MTDDTLSKNLTDLAHRRTLYWKHRKTPMVAKSIINNRSSLTGEESLMIRFDKVPTLDEIIPRSRMEKSFYLITEDAYKRVFDALPKLEAPKWTVDLEAGTAFAALELTDDPPDAGGALAFLDMLQGASVHTRDELAVLLMKDYLSRGAHFYNDFAQQLKEACIDKQPK